MDFSPENFPRNPGHSLLPQAPETRQTTALATVTPGSAPTREGTLKPLRLGSASGLYASA